MGSDKTSISYQGNVGIGEAKSVLRSLLESLEDGRVVVRRGDEHLTLTPSANLELELTGKHKKGRESLELYLSWRLDEHSDSGASLLISSQEPEPPPILSAEPSAEADAETADAEADAGAAPEPV